ncbi:MAG: cysteine desulfurase [Lachnospiraceae bacterium]|nr:cysteine desulfurase [Lachnospiraceae bacterium]
MAEKAGSVWSGYESAASQYGDAVNVVPGYTAPQFNTTAETASGHAAPQYSGLPDQTVRTNVLQYGLAEAEYENLVGELLSLSGIEQKQTEKEAASGYYAPVVVSKDAAQTGDAVRPVQADPAGQKHNSRIMVGSKTLEQIRSDFPILSEKVNGHDLVWLDNGATTQRPKAVIDRLTHYYEHENSNVHRGAHALAARSTDAYEAARQTVADFIGAGNKDNIIFVRGTTEGINLVAHAYVKQYLSHGDEIIVTLLEHHANIVPWQLVAQETGAVLKVVPVDESGQIILSEYEKLFTKRTKFVSATHVSNALGTVTPVAELVAIAHRHGVRILIDGAQSVAHIPINVTTLDADFFVFSGHKIFAPTGIGAVYGKKELLEDARPYHGGGNMIADVTFERTLYNPAPNKFEAGTGSIADAVGMGAALDYLNRIGMPAVNAHEHELLLYATKEMKKIPGLHLVGTAANKASALSFKLDGVSDEAVGKRLDEYGIAVRVGHHCAQPILRHFGLESVVRPTLALYNSPEDIDALVKAIRTLV